MSSPKALSRQNSHLLMQDDPYTLGPRGSTLATLLRRRPSTTSVSLVRDEEEAVVGAGLPGSGAVTPSASASFPVGLSGSPEYRRELYHDDEDVRRHDERRLSALLNNPQMRSMRLIGKAKRYRWERYWKTEDQLKVLSAPLRAYYERNNMLIQQYLYIDRLLNSSLPHDLLNEYNSLHSSRSYRGLEVPATISEESMSASPTGSGQLSTPPLGGATAAGAATAAAAARRVKRTPKAIYRPAETTPLLEAHGTDDEDEDDSHDPDEERLPTPGGSGLQGNGYGAATMTTTAAAATIADADADTTSPTGSQSPRVEDIPLLLEEDEDVDSTAPVVTLAIYVNLAANAILLAGKLAVVLSVPSISVLASLVDAVLDFLSTAIVWTTTWLISNQDQYRYPVGRRRLEPLGVLVFSVIMITSFVQVMLQAVQHLASDDRSIIELGIPALAIMFNTIVIKGLCWLWCRLVKNSSVQALAADAMTDVIFNAGSIAFPIVGFYARIWWLDALGGLLLSLVVILNWSRTSIEHIKHLSGFSATADQRNILLYLTMRFAKTIRAIQGLQAYHGGDKLIVEVDIVLDANMSLKDSHDLSESLQYVIESVPIVDRAFVHADYADYNLPTHMEQQA
ncbi:cation diffusion facilitator [Grosmannia clavigera kw1407]|uniref:Cation diffusion facilitator n=1 Tax=Grosmannia clavigera (strain kw1407 / UAMH 11150) TaxID=655863 RepID=F0XUX0_GROCL|nr:cation diffusion facilitator [Grosmannia clavigera kw1407]EFW98842.1 cation diffusion facilitator [Grosmannia clavigera kw1407]